MKVLLLGLGDTFGGVEKYFYDRLPYIVKDHEIFIGITYVARPMYIEKLIELGCQCIHIPQLRELFQYYSRLKKIILENQFDVVYCNVAFANILLYKAVESSGAKLIIHAHNSGISFSSSLKTFFFEQYHRVSKFLESNVKATRYACSSMAGKWVYNDTNSFKLRKNTIDLEKFLYNESIRKQKRLELGYSTEFLVGTVARLSPQKNVGYLIDLAKLLVDRDDNIRIIVVGNGEEYEYLEKKIKELKLDKIVRLLGERSDVSQLLQAIDCFVMPSHFEGLGIVLIEAQVTNLSCVVSDTIPKEVKINKNVVFLNLNRSKDLWVSQILGMKKNVRRDKSKAILESGYVLSKDHKDYKEFFKSNDE